MCECVVVRGEGREMEQLEHCEEMELKKGGQGGQPVGVASPTTWGHGEVPARAALRATSGSIVTQSMLISLTHITTRERGDVLCWNSHEAPWECQGMCITSPTPP